MLFEFSSKPESASDSNRGQRSHERRKGEWMNKTVISGLTLSFVFFFFFSFFIYSTWADWIVDRIEFLLCCE